VIERITEERDAQSQTEILRGKFGSYGKDEMLEKILQMHFR